MNEENDRPEQGTTGEKPPVTPPAIPPAIPHTEPKLASTEVEAEPAKAIEGELNFSTLLSHLLKKPMNVLVTMEEKKFVPWSPLMLLAFSCLLVFGLVIGTFSAGDQLWAAPLKVMGGVAFSALICLPSLYIFSCLAGIEARFQTIAGILACAISLVALLLVGFAPVVWLFSTSSDSLFFIGFLCLVLWIICLSFGFRFIGKAAYLLGAKNGFHLRVWTVVFLLVTLQMPVTLRPIIGKSDKFLNLEEKKFFLTHWAEQISGDSEYSDTQPSKKQNGNSDRDFTR